MTLNKDYILKLKRNTTSFEDKESALKGLKGQLTSAQYGDVRIAVFNNEGKEDMFLGIKGISEYKIFEGASIKTNVENGEIEGIDIPESVQKALDEIKGVIEAGVISDISKEGDVMKAYKGEEEIDLSLNYASALDDTMKTTSAIGGIAKDTTAETLKKKTLSQIFDMIFFPEINPTITAPSASISLKTGYASVQKAGAVAPTKDNFNYSLNRGSITLNGAKQNDRAGEYDSHHFYYGTNSSANQDGNGWPSNFSSTPGQTYTYGVIVNYKAGPQPKTSYGNNYSTPLAAGNVTATTNITTSLPFYSNGKYTTNATQITGLPTTFAEEEIGLQTWSKSDFHILYASESANKTRLYFDFPAEKKVTKVAYVNTMNTNQTIEIASDKYKIDTLPDTAHGRSYKRLTTTSESLFGEMHVIFTIANA